LHRGDQRSDSIAPTKVRARTSSAAGKPVEITRVRITEAGRRALAEPQGNGTLTWL
jgi:hypothetical protein